VLLYNRIRLHLTYKIVSDTLGNYQLRFCYVGLFDTQRFADGIQADGSGQQSISHRQSHVITLGSWVCRVNHESQLFLGWHNLLLLGAGITSLAIATRRRRNRKGNAF